MILEHELALLLSFKTITFAVAKIIEARTLPFVWNPQIIGSISFASVSWRLIFLTLTLFGADDEAEKMRRWSKFETRRISHTCKKMIAKIFWALIHDCKFYEKIGNMLVMFVVQNI